MKEEKYIVIKEKKIPLSPIVFDDEKFIDRNIMKENFLILRNCLEENNIFYGLIYGTLLGAIRERNFIEYDHDADIYLFYEDKKRFLEVVLEDLLNKGFKIIRERRNMISLIRKDNYIDFYFFERKPIRKKAYRFMGPIKYPAEILEKSIQYSFLGEMFRIPKNYIRFLEISYGKDWRTPKKNCLAQTYSNYFHKNLSKILRDLFPAKTKRKYFLKKIKDNCKPLRNIRI